MEEDEVRLHSHHGWRARPGCKIFVADRGAVRFDYPQNWFVLRDEGCITLCDKEPPDDISRLSVSYQRLPPIDWSGLPIVALLEAAVPEDRRTTETSGPISDVTRGDLELAWREARFLDPSERREARSRMCIARRSSLQCLITFDFWATDLEQCQTVWDTVLETLELGEFIADPRRGPVVS